MIVYIPKLKLTETYMDILNIARYALKKADIQFEELSGIQMNRSPFGGHCLMMMVFTGGKQPTAFLRVSTDTKRSAALKTSYKNLKTLRTSLPTSFINSVPEPLMLEEKNGVTIFLESVQHATPIKKLPPNSYFKSKGFNQDFTAVIDWLTAFNKSLSTDSSEITEVQHNNLLYDAIAKYRQRFSVSSVLDALLNETADTLNKAKLNLAPRHADFCTANVLIDQNHSVSVIDWEEELKPTWQFCDLLHFMSSTWCIKYGRSLAEQQLNYQSMFFKSTHLTETLQQGAHKYAKSMNLDASMLMPLSVMTWVFHALHKANYVKRFAKNNTEILMQRVQPITIINNNQCLNLEILAAEKHNYIFKE